MSRPAVKIEGGKLWWRGSSDFWTYAHPTFLARLGARFAADPEPYSQDFARQIEAALRRFNPQHMEHAA